MVTASSSVSNSQGQIFQWDTETGNQITDPISDDTLIAVTDVGETRFATGNIQGDVRLYESGETKPITAFSFKSPIFRVAFNSSRNELLVVSGRVVWRQPVDDRRAELIAKCRREPFLAVSPDGNAIALRYGVTMQVVDADNGADMCIAAKHKLKVSRMLWADCSTVVTASDDGGIRLFDVSRGVFREEETNVSGWIQSLQICAKSRLLLVAVEKKGKPRRGIAQLFDLDSLQPVSPEFDHEQLVIHATMDSARELVVTASADKSAAVWNSKSGDRIKTLQHTGTVYEATIHPSGWLLTRATDVAYLWRQFENSN